MILFLKILFFFILLSLGATALSLAPWVPTKKKDLKRIAKLANMKKGQVFYDLGCGDGRVSAYISKNTPGKAIGVELAIPFFFISYLRKIFSWQKNLSFQLKNLFKIDLKKADVVFLFAASRDKLTGKIIKKLETELKTGAKIITYAFPIVAWKPEKIDKPQENDISIYLYRK